MSKRSREDEESAPGDSSSVPGSPSSGSKRTRLHSDPAQSPSCNEERQRQNAELVQSWEHGLPPYEQWPVEAQKMIQPPMGMTVTQFDNVLLRGLGSKARAGAEARRRRGLAARVARGLILSRHIKESRPTATVVLPPDLDPIDLDMDLTPQPAPAFENTPWGRQSDLKHFPAFVRWPASLILFCQPPSDFSWEEWHDLLRRGLEVKALAEAKNWDEMTAMVVSGVMEGLVEDTIIYDVPYLPPSGAPTEILPTEDGVGSGSMPRQTNTLDTSNGVAIQEGEPDSQASNNAAAAPAPFGGARASLEPLVPFLAGALSSEFPAQASRLAEVEWIRAELKETYSLLRQPNLSEHHRAELKESRDWLQRLHQEHYSNLPSGQLERVTSSVYRQLELMAMALQGKLPR